MNIAILGVGGVGGYFGAKICRVSEALRADVYFVARGAHLEAIRKNGLTVRTSSEGVIHCRPTLATSDIGELPTLDACLVCVKSYDLDDVTRRLASKVADRTEVVPLLNGIDIHDRVRANVRNGHAYPACVFIGTHIQEPGVISQEGGACRILFGKVPGETADGTPVVADVFRESSISSEWHEDIAPALWSKFVFIAPFSLVTACFGATLGQVMGSDELSAMVRAAIGEILALAEASGVRLPASIAEDAYRKGADFPPDTKTSFQRDVEMRDRPDERDSLGGTVLRLGARLGIATPRVHELYETINRRKPMRLK